MDNDQFEQYLQDVLFLHELPKAYSKILDELSKRILITKNKQTVYITAGMKKEIAKNIRCSISYINNGITNLNKKKVLERVDTGTYAFNPSLFGYKEIADRDNIESIALNITLTHESKKIQVEFEMKSSL